MKKYLLLICVTAFLATGCGNTNKVKNAVVADKINEVNEQAESDKNSQEYKEQVYALTKAVLAYTKAIKYSGENCELTSEGVASCFAKHMSENTLDKKWQFVINNDCHNVGECKIIVDDQIEIVLYPDEDGYLTTSEPPKPW